MRYSFWAFSGMGFVALAAGVTRAATTLVNDGFESYAAGILDKNQSGPNAAPNGSGNPWWGSGSANMDVVGAESGVTPHGGSSMLRADTATTGNKLLWQNIAYRDNGGQPISGNLTYTYYFYDPTGATNGATYKDNSAVAYYSLTSSNSDYTTASGTTTPISLSDNSTVIDRLQLGASNYTTHTANYPQTFDATKYQVRVGGYTAGFNSAGWVNTALTRSVGWHEGEIVIGPADANGSNVVSFYIDDLTTPLITTNTTVDRGYNILEFTSEGASRGYFDDATLAQTPEPAALGAISLAALSLLRRRR